MDRGAIPQEFRDRVDAGGARRSHREPAPDPSARARSRRRPVPLRSRIEPIFLEKREGHTRCYVCHAESNNSLRLEKLSSGSASWTEEQSRKNFETVSMLVVPGDLTASRLLIHPLAPEAGGDLFHSDLGSSPFSWKSAKDTRAATSVTPRAIIRCAWKSSPPAARHGPRSNPARISRPCRCWWCPAISPRAGS